MKIRVHAGQVVSWWKWKSLSCVSLRPHVLYRRRQWQPTPVLLPGKSHGQRSLVGCSPWGCEELDTTKRLHFHALEKEMATHSSVLAWRIPGMAEPGGLLFMGLHRVRHDWSNLAAAAAAMNFQDLVTVYGQHTGPFSYSSGTDFETICICPCTNLGLIFMYKKHTIFLYSINNESCTC